MWGVGGVRLFAELLHYPVAIDANCNFPGVLGAITVQLQVEPMASVRHPRWGPSIPGQPATLSLSPHHSAMSPSGGQTELQFLCLISSLISLEKSMCRQD